ncbi:hypothetical protein B0H10DRAFT_2214475 [Mycena sp. CBHHK59/15]|nr:hypothetical protein B0H10DRAFT_2214475 [Mycena sp. CBHHK59/15]
MEAATKKKPNLSKLLVWGTPIWVKVKGAKDLDKHTIEVQFVGYDIEAKGFHSRDTSTTTSPYPYTAKRWLNTAQAEYGMWPTCMTTAHEGKAEEEVDNNSDLVFEADEMLCYSQVVEFALVTESVKMSLREAINGTDAKHWTPAAQAKFTEIKKLNT